MRYKIRIKQANGVHIITVTADSEKDAKDKLKLLPDSQITGIKQIKEI